MSIACSMFQVYSSETACPFKVYTIVYLFVISTWMFVVLAVAVALAPTLAPAPPPVPALAGVTVVEAAALGIVTVSAMPSSSSSLSSSAPVREASVGNTQHIRFVVSRGVTRHCYSTVLDLGQWDALVILKGHGTQQVRYYM